MGPPLPTVTPDDALAVVEERLIAEGVDRVVAVEDGEALGVVTASDVLVGGAPDRKRRPRPPQRRGSDRRSPARRRSDDGIGRRRRPCRGGVLNRHVRLADSGRLRELRSARARPRDRERAGGLSGVPRSVTRRHLGIARPAPHLPAPNPPTDSPVGSNS